MIASEPSQRNATVPTIIGQPLVMKSVMPSSIRVGSGSLAPRLRYRPVNLGRMNTDITTIATPAMKSTTTG